MIHDFYWAWLYCCVCLIPSIHLYSFPDLEENTDLFVLKTQKISIPEYPHAFNPSIVRWKGKLLLSFRVLPYQEQPYHSWLGLVWLDDQFKPSSKPQRIITRKARGGIPSRAEDGRLIVVGHKLFLVYSDNEDPVISRGGFRMYIAELDYDGISFWVKSKERISSFEGNSDKKREKNWVPFEYANHLLLAYSLVPHTILHPLFGTGHCETFSSSKTSMNWQWGELRGGTPALEDGDHYLAFFHSSTLMATFHSRDKYCWHYFIGAYTFSRSMPFALTNISKKPIIGKNFYHGADYKPYWKPVQVVFPCGFIMDDSFIWLVYGRQDHEMWVAQLDKKLLYESLVPLNECL